MSWGHDQRMEALRLLASWDVQEKILHMCGVSLHVHTLRRSQGQRQEKSGSFLLQGSARDAFILGCSLTTFLPNLVSV